MWNNTSNKKLRKSCTLSKRQGNDTWRFTKLFTWLKTGINLSLLISKYNNVSKNRLNKPNNKIVCLSLVRIWNVLNRQNSITTIEAIDVSVRKWRLMALRSQDVSSEIADVVSSRFVVSYDIHSALGVSRLAYPQFFTLLPYDLTEVTYEIQINHVQQVSSTIQGQGQVRFVSFMFVTFIFTLKPTLLF